HNLRRVRELAPHSQVMAVVKADGYGHGLKEVAKALIEADALAVARLEEGLALRQADHRHPIIVLEGITDKEELQLAAAYQLVLVIQEATEIEVLRQTPVKAPLLVWLKIDTGMHRLGFPPEAMPEVATSLRGCRAVASVVGLMSHLATADQAEDPLTAI